jgi:hypothetical protein
VLSALRPASAPRRNGGKLPEPYRIDVHHHVATQNNPLYDVPDGMSWWSVDNALRVMDGNQIRVAMLFRLPWFTGPPLVLAAIFATPARSSSRFSFSKVLR